MISAPLSAPPVATDDVFGNVREDTSVDVIFVDEGEFDTDPAVNDSPFFVSISDLPSIGQDDINSLGAQINSLVFGFDPDVDGSIAGIAVIANPVTKEGDWEYSSDGGTTWAAIGRVNDTGSAQAISLTSKLRFNPAAGFNGVAPALSIRLLDDTHSSFSDITASAVFLDTSTNDGTTGISFAVGMLGISVISSTENTQEDTSNWSDAVVPVTADDVLINMTSTGITFDAVAITFSGAAGQNSYTGKGSVDMVVMGDGNGTIDNIGAGDIVYGQGGDDEFEITNVTGTGFKQIDGGEGFDTLLLSGNIDLTELQSIDNIERIDINGGTGMDQVTLDIADLIDMVDDNSLDYLLTGGAEKLLIDSDANDAVILNGQDLSDISGGTRAAAGITSDYADINIEGENYIKFVHAGLDLELYVHSDLVDDTPL